MAKKMLIDATHPEETRVVVADGNKVEEFDFENLNRRQLAGNIYLAKVTRVEPSLQAAFIDYGGNRHGFLAFSEIHPDYYQIPKADRDAILAEERALAAAQAEADEAADSKAAAAREVRGEADDDAADDADEADAGDAEAGKDESGRKGRSRSRSRSRSRRKADDAGAGGAAEEEGATTAHDALDDEARARQSVVSGSAAEVSEAATDAGRREGAAAAGAQNGSDDDGDDDDAGAVRTIAEDTGLEDETVTGEPSGMETMDVEEEDDSDPVEDPAPRRTSRSRSRKKAADKDESVETVGEEDEPEDIRPVRIPRPKARKYKIQEVVKVRQIMLVQVVKEERGNKGAALTTYLSLAGRYCVLMPNTARGGGISRKITNTADRKKLKEIAQEIDVPQGAGLIVRTAGAKRTKTEIKRDYEYLQRMWEQVRELTLKSIAPAPIYEEGNLIHRSIRDLYNRDIDEVIVEGEAGFRDARDYMKLIMPSHAKNVKLHPQDGQPLFAKHGVESYLASMFSPTVQLKSGGYIVIGITEALVAIDVNSGKSTKEGSIEETATKTNLEAADEVARQMRLRDLAGLIVIDFIDMDERRNNAAVEKRLKEALKNDRARLQVGRISGFGLLEMSRQRLRPGMLEATTQSCPHCHGTGLIRSDESVALQILRTLEEEGVRKRSGEVKLSVPVEVCNYLMNEKREHLAAIEARYDMAVRVMADPLMISPDHTLEKFKTATRVIPKVLNVVQNDVSWTSDDEDAIEEEVDDEEEADAEERTEEDSPEPRQEAREPAERPSDEQDGPSKKKRRRRSRRRKSGGGDEEGATRESRQDEEESREESADEGMSDVDRSAEPASGEDRPAEDPSGEDDRTGSGRSRRRRSGGRRGEARGDDAPETAGSDAAGDAPEQAPVVSEVGGERDPAEAGIDPPVEDTVEPPAGAAVEAAPAPKSRSRTRSRSKKGDTPDAAPAADAAPEEAAPAEPAPAEAAPETAGASKPRSRARAKAPVAGPSEAVTTAAEVAEAAQDPAEAQDSTEEQTSEGSDELQPAEISAEQAPPAAPEPEEQAKPKRKGWWSFGS